MSEKVPRYKINQDVILKHLGTTKVNPPRGGIFGSFSKCVLIFFLHFVTIFCFSYSVSLCCETLILLDTEVRFLILNATKLGFFTCILTFYNTKTKVSSSIVDKNLQHRDPRLKKF